MALQIQKIVGRNCKFHPVTGNYISTPRGECQKQVLRLQLWHHPIASNFAKIICIQVADLHKCIWADLLDLESFGFVDPSDLLAVDFGPVIRNKRVRIEKLTFI